MNPLKFGVFMAPHHVQGVNPTMALEEDLKLVTLFDELGFDEVWFGEHHSGGMEIIGSPELMIAAAIARTRNIKLCTGVLSASYHNPLWIADRAVLLDHLSRGRFILGLGPGALPSDAAMIGLDMSQTRDLLADAVHVITELFRTEEPVNFKNDRWTLKDAVLQLRPYTYPHPEIAIAGAVSPSGAKLAGRYGHSLVSLGATTTDGFDALGSQWSVMEERSAHYGTTVDRTKWRLLGVMHVAETRKQAFDDVAYGIESFIDYVSDTVAFAFGAFDKGSGSMKDLISSLVDSGWAAIGTPDDAIAQIERLQKQSNGGFGGYLQLCHDWAPPEAKRRSYELFARHVAPVFQGQHHSAIASRDRVRAMRPALLRQANAAVEAATAKYKAEVARGD